MNEVAKVFIILVTILHFYFMVLEMFLWTKPLGLKTFKQSKQAAKDSAILAANQGLYNGFLSAGLIWGMTNPNHEFGFQIAIFFLTCVITAGAYGACTVNKRIFFVQSCPAMIALGALLFG